MLSARASEQSRDLGAFAFGSGGEAVAEPPRARIDAELTAGFGIDEPEFADIRQLLLARVADFDGDHRMAAAEFDQRIRPIAWAAEIRDDDDEA